MAKFKLQLLFLGLLFLIIFLSGCRTEPVKSIVAPVPDDITYIYSEQDMINIGLTNYSFIQKVDTSNFSGYGPFYRYSTSVLPYILGIQVVTESYADELYNNYYLSLYHSENYDVEETNEFGDRSFYYNTKPELPVNIHGLVILKSNTIITFLYNKNYESKVRQLASIGVNRI